MHLKSMGLTISTKSTNNKTIIVANRKNSGGYEPVTTRKIKNSST